MNDQLMAAAALHGSAENELYTPFERLKFALQALDRYAAETEKLIREKAALTDALEKADRHGGELVALRRNSHQAQLQAEVERDQMRDKLAQVWSEGYMQAVANGTDHWGVVNPYAQKAEES